MGSITHGEDKLCADEKYAGIPQDCKDYFADVVAERINSLVAERSGDEVEGEVEVRKGEIGEEQTNELVKKLNV